LLVTKIKFEVGTL